ncbi:immunoglobulin-binding protein 1-like [Dreissena polymorpha]|nr:immunoglobulin-binding protein 1-like [Dreissena polymorpha]
MAESIAVTDNLPQTFNEIWQLYQTLEKNEEPTGSDKIQGCVYRACELCKKAISMVNQLHVFSDNEDIEEVATTNIRYMLLPGMLGYFLMKNTVRSRLAVVKESQEFYADFMKMCHNYGVTKYEIHIPSSAETEKKTTENKTSKPTGPPDVRGMANVRAGKIQRYKEQKELERKLNELQVTALQEHTDDEVKREYYMTLLKHWVNFCIEELDSIKDEITILEMMEHRKGEPSKHNPKNEHHEHKPLRPFIITKDAIQKQVYGLGYPSIPTMTIEEFFDKKVEEGTLSKHVAGSHSMQDWAADPEADQKAREKEEAEKEERQERDDEGELQKARDWDEYRDDHRRGWGNRKNRH